MNFSPKPLEFAPGAWRSLMLDLRARGGGRRESGAFLLTRAASGVPLVETWLPYDELDPASLNRNFIKLESNAFATLWDVCAQRGLQVVADVHTHRFGPGQSDSDRAHPMVSLPGHIALIAPGYAAGEVEPHDVSFNVFLGDSQWWSCYGNEAESSIVAP